MSLSIAPASAAPLVDGSQSGSLTIHKSKSPTICNPGGGGGSEDRLDAEGTDGDGVISASSCPSLEPLPGVEFTINKVNTIDLATQAGWDAASTLSGAFSAADATNSITAAGYTLGASQAVTMDTAGIATFSSLQLGLYLVQETNFPAGTTPSAPFLVTVPQTDPKLKGEWIYDVHAYPKNSVSVAEKTVSDAADIKVGDQIDFTITRDIPNETVIDGYRISDTLDSKLEYFNAEAKLADGTVITQGVDYTISVDWDTTTVSVTFTDAGLALLAAHTDTRVQLVITTTVMAIGEIENVGLLYPNLGSFTVLPGKPGGPLVTAPVVTKWGEMTLQKVDRDGAALQGAVFSVYTNEADAKAGTNPVELNYQTLFQVGADGTLTLSGLRYSNWADGVAVAPGDANYRTYYLVEVSAPAGFELLAEAVPFAVDATTSAVGIDLNVVNVPSNAGFQLPKTGGPGTVLLYAGGALLLGGAALLMVRQRRANNANQ